MAEATGPTDLFSNLFERSVGRLTTRSALVIVAIVTVVGQAPVLGHYFLSDDFVPLADIASRTNGGYLKALLLLDDETPNWRFLTGLFYLGAYRAFALDPLPYLVASVLVHIGTAGLIFHFVRRAAGDIWLAMLAAALFGLTPASVPTVGQVTAINNVFGGFLLMLSLVLVYEAFDRRPFWFWIAGSAVAFAGAVAANESLALLAPAPALVALVPMSREAGWWRDRGRLTQLVLIAAPFAIIGSAALIGLVACECTSNAASSRYGAGSHMVDNLWLFLGRLLYPVGMEPLGESGTAHLVAGPVLAAVALAAFVRGPAFSRFAVALLTLALLPFLPLKLWSAPRYVYLASIPFSMLAALVVWEVASLGRRLSPITPAAITVAIIGVLGLFIWQTWSQNEDFDYLTSDWEALVGGIEDTYPDLPEGSTVYVRGGPLTEPLLQCVVLPALGEVIWGGSKLFTLADGSNETYRARPGYAVFLADAVDGSVVPAALPIASEGEGGVTLLPHVPPYATGNLCLDDVPGFP
jgi:hypothetical protein